jgi:hypothetical protein
MHSALLFHQGVWQLSAIDDCFVKEGYGHHSFD